MYIASLHSAGCLPDSDTWPVECETAREAWEYIADDIELIAEDGDYLAAHTALHVQDWDAPGVIPASEGGLYRYSVEVSA